MAYKSQVTQKWFGSTNKGRVRLLDARTTEMGQIVSALRNDFTPALNKFSEAYVEKKQTVAGAKMEELYASGWDTKKIRDAILNGDFPELSNHYVTSVVDTHAGRFEATETWRKIEANLDKYDYKDGTQTIENFWKPYLPELNTKSKEFVVGFSAVFQELATNAKIKDAQNRAEHSHNVKINKAISFMDTTTTIADIKSGIYFKKLMTLNTAMPDVDGKKAYYFDTNELNEEIAMGHVKWLIDTATSTDQLDKALILLTQDRGKGKGGNKLGSLSNTYSEEARQLILSLNNKRRVLENDGRQAKDDAEKEDVSGIFTELMTDVDVVVAGLTTGTRKRTHEEVLALRERLEVYGNPTYIAAFDKLASVERWKETDPNVFNRLISDIGDGKYESLDAVLDAMMESEINPDDWKAALTYYNAFDEDIQKGKMPIYQTNQTYKDLIKINLNAVKGNYMEKVGNIFIEKPNSFLAQANADAYMKVEIIAFEKRYRDEFKKEPTFKERNEFMNDLRKVIVEQFTDENVSPNLKSFTEYEADIAEEERLEKVKTEKYERAGVTQTTKDIYEKIDLEELNFPAIVKKITESFDPSFLGLEDIFGESDSEWGESDRESKRRFIEEKFTASLADMFKDIGITKNMITVMETADYNNLLKETAKRIEDFAGTTVTPQMIDQAFQIVTKAIKKGT